MWADGVGGTVGSASASRVANAPTKQSFFPSRENNPSFLLVLAVAAVRLAAAETRPIILWFIVDDLSANFSCYGKKLIATPHVDRLAREGTRFSWAFTTAPVCSPCQSGFITGMCQTTIGEHHHRSGRGTEKIVLPTGVVPVLAIFQGVGYHMCIGGCLRRDAGVRERRRTRPGRAAAWARPTTISSGTRRFTMRTIGPGGSRGSRFSCRCSWPAENSAAAPTRRPKRSRRRRSRNLGRDRSGKGHALALFPA